MRRLYLYGAGLTILCLAQVRFVAAQNFGDWSAFQSAGGTVGTPALLDPVQHAKWQSAHHVAHSTFPYLPGAAWLLVPVAHIPPAAGYAVNFFVMAAATLAAALLASKIYGLPKDVAAVTAFAWAPLVAGLATGQNAALGLLLCLCAIAGLARRSPLVIGLACGALLYKLLFALPLIVLLAVRREWRALGVAAVCGALWYLLGVAATAGQWSWPVHYASAIRGYALHDFQVNAVKAIGIPQLLMRAGVLPSLAYACGAALFVLVLPAVRRMDAVRGAGAVLAAALACGPHTQPYDLALMLPAIWWYLRDVSEAAARAVVAAMYAIAPLWLLSGVFRFDVLAPLCIGFAALALYDGTGLRRKSANAASA